MINPATGWFKMVELPIIEIFKTDGDDVNGWAMGYLGAPLRTESGAESAVQPETDLAAGRLARA